MKRKFLAGAVLPDTGLSPRQIRVRASDATQDLVGDILVPKGCTLLRPGMPVKVFIDHDASVETLVGTADVQITDKSVDALITFLDQGLDANSDMACAKAKAGALTDVSVGFDPIEVEPRKGGGFVFTKWTLLEISMVGIGCNPSAIVQERAMPTKIKDVKPLKLKDLYTVAWLAQLLNELGYLTDSSEWEAEYEGDGSEVPAMLAESMNQLGAALIAMTAEEVAELLRTAGGDKATFASRVKSFRSIIKAGRVLSAANETDIKAAVDLISGASDKLSGVLGQLDQADDADDTGDAKAATASRAKRRREVEVLSLYPK